MFIYKNSIKNIKSLLYQKKIKKMSNASFYITKIKSLLPLQYKYKKLLYFKKSNAGRSKYGQIVVYSKGKKKRTWRQYQSCMMHFMYRVGCLSPHITTQTKRRQTLKIKPQLHMRLCELYQCK